MQINLMVLLFSLLAASCNRNSPQQAENKVAEAAAEDKTGGPAPVPAATNYRLAVAFPDLTFDQPVELVSPDDGTGRLFVLAQEGTIHVFPNKPEVREAPVFLNIKSRVVDGGERGLLGLAFHPNFKNNGYFYVNYTRGNPLETAISRFRVRPDNPNAADPESEEVLLTFRQPYSNHNGGKIAFGPDGYLYIAVGDGGSGGDPQNYGQNRKELLGKILRLDVDKPGNNRKYGIPADNPYRGNTEGFREEIFAYGLRNPWRFNFDRETGQLWAGDVGQNQVEEIDLIRKGGNYGWKIMEADACFTQKGCDQTGLEKPVWSYQQGAETGRSVTGGYVCRDKSLPGLAGKYIYGDFVSGNIWALTHDGKKALQNQQIAKINAGLSSFGEDSDRRLYVLSYGEGKIYRLVADK